MWPSSSVVCLPVAALWRAAPVSTIKCLAPLPSVPNDISPISAIPSVEIKHAAAASPKIERLLLSEGCRYLLYVSAVSKSTFFAIPPAIRPLATAIP